VFLIQDEIAGNIVRALRVVLSGIALDATNKRFVIVQLGGKSVLAWRPGDKVPTVIAKGPGG
jgi:hypothetical protein